MVNVYISMQGSKGRREGSSGGGGGGENMYVSKSSKKKGERRGKDWVLLFYYSGTMDFWVARFN